MWPNPQETTDLVTFTEEILNGKLFLCSVIYGSNINENCFSDRSSADMNKTDAQNFFQHMKLYLQKFFNRFEKEFILALKERHIYDKKWYSNYNNDLMM